MLKLYRRIKNLWSLSKEPSVKDLLKKGYKVTDQFGNTYEGEGIQPISQAKPKMAQIIRRSTSVDNFLKNNDI